MTNYERELTFSSNVSYTVGMYKGIINMLLQEIEGLDLKGWKKEAMTRYANLAKENLELGEMIWDNRYEKHYNQVNLEFETRKQIQKELAENFTKSN